MEVFKLYTDGSYNYQNHKAGIGGYLLDSKNKIVFHFYYQLKRNVQNHEKMALLLGLLKCKKLGIKNLICHFDDISLQKRYGSCVKSINKDNIDRKINNLKRTFNFVQFIFIPREENTIADKLASTYSINEDKNSLTRKRLSKNTLNLKNLIFESNPGVEAFELSLYCKRVDDKHYLLVYDKYDKLIYHKLVISSPFDNMLEVLQLIKEPNVQLSFSGSGEINQIAMILGQYKPLQTDTKNAYKILNKFKSIIVKKDIDKTIKAHIYSSLVTNYKEKRVLSSY